MISAKEARIQTQNNIDVCLTKELVRLEEKISNAILEGEFSVSGEGSLNEFSRKRLEELGYRVKTDTQYNDPHYYISWNEI